MWKLIASISLVLCAQAREGLCAQARAAVVLSPADDLRLAVEAHPQATTFRLKPGLYRLQSVAPKDRDVFIGDDGAVMSGARLLETFERDGDLYVARDQPVDPNAMVHGECRRNFPRCGHPQDLYFDGKPLRAVAKKSELGPGRFFYDYRHAAVYFADDPAGRTVELSVTPFAFGGHGRDVTIENVTVEKYACADQQGAIGDQGQGHSWTIRDSEVRLNHGVGIIMPPGSSVLHDFVHDNGEMGIGDGGGSGAIQDSEIASNVWNGTDCNWECGGVKWSGVTEWIVTGNDVHDNQGPGLWADIDSQQMLIDGNRIERNLLAGVSIEISNNAIVSNNVFTGNGARRFHWGWYGQVQIQNSHAVQVEDNTLVLDPRRGGNGIVVIQQDRGARHMPKDNRITGNDVTLAAGDGVVAGWFADYRPNAFAASNVFDDNRYHVAAPDGMFWAPNEWTTFAAWQATGQDVHSAVDGAP
ncbi:MAG: right-handed parallel beta-helix repeat-containing protein [Alphaproteobacteria bacterium]|nr:right-handed parallel beta-helix repeat-containing protein [Alphaproteobacteria bacterium]